MNELLAMAIDAHGGLDRWKAVDTLTLDLSIDGALWGWKQLPGVFRNKQVVVSTKLQRVMVASMEAARLGYTPERVWLEDHTGQILDERADLERPFSDQAEDVPWDLFQAAVFNGRALWTYFNGPFLYSQPGFGVEEIDPWEEEGEVWRSLRITFPDRIRSHTRTQVVRFGADGLIRRHDYAVDLLGGARGVNYASGYRDFGGIMFPTMRRVFPCDEALQRIPEPLLISIDVSNVTLKAES